MKMVYSLPVLAILLATAMSSIFVVDVREKVLILQFGEVKQVVDEPGLYFKAPFIQEVFRYDDRILGLVTDPTEITFADQRRLVVDAFARFRITQPDVMYRTIRTEDRLREQLKTILGSSLRNELGKRTFVALLSAERGEVMENIQTALNREAKKYGAEVIDVRIKRADLPAATLQSAYNRMRSARNQEAIAIDAEGQKEAQIIRADAEAEAARIYAISYGKDPGFYDFYRAMQSYRQTFQNGEGSSNIILSPQNAYLEKFRTGR